MPVSPENGILLVEDHEDVANSLCFLLDTLGYPVRREASAQEALGAVQSFTPTLVILDIGLPDMNGFELASKLRESGLEETPLVALSGYPPDQFFEGEPPQVFEEYLLKPATMENLQKALAHIKA